jgi:DNA-binding CsgD family transcriptional regulator
MEALGDRWLRTNVHDVLGQVAYTQGEFQAAKRHFEAAYAIHAAFGTLGGMAVHLRNLGEVALRQQEWPEARTLYQQSLKLYQEIGDRGGVVAAQSGLGIAAQHIGDLNGARRHFGQALEAASGTRSVRLILSALTEAGEFLVQAAGTSRGRAMGLRALRFVCQHPLCDRNTSAAAAAYLQRHGDGRHPAPDDTLESLAAMLQSELVVPERVFSPPLDSQAQASMPVEPLTTRELDVLRLLAKGRSNTEIAGELVVAEGTVKAHTSSIYRKLEVANRTRAIVRARELGLLD